VAPIACLQTMTHLSVVLLSTVLSRRGQYHDDQARVYRVDPCLHLRHPLLYLWLWHVLIVTLLSVSFGWTNLQCISLKTLHIG